MAKENKPNAHGIVLQDDGAFVDLQGDFYLQGELGRARLRGNGYTLIDSDDREIQKAILKSLGQEVPAKQKSLGEFIEIPWRMLSKTIVEGWWLDFTKDDVLKKATDKFSNITIYTDHEANIRNWVGSTKLASWEEAVGKNPAGINNDFKIDALSEPKIARGLLMEPPAIKSNSVGIHFKASKSHPDMERYDFHQYMGREVDGQVVRWIVEEISDVVETSLVYAGADRFANRQDLAKVFAGTDFTEKENILTNKQEGKTMKFKLMRSLLNRIGIDPAKLGFEADQQSREVESETMHTAMELSAARVSSLENKLEQFAGLFGKEKFEKDFDYDKKIAELKSLLAEPAKELEKQREEALAKYNQLEGENPNEVMQDMIGKASLNEARAFNAKFEADLKIKHPLGPDGKNRGSSLSPTVPGSKGNKEKAQTIDSGKFKTGGAK